MSMKKHDIRSFMLSLPILAGILGRKLGVKIQIGGAPSTDGKTIYLPPLPFDGGEELFILANGFIDHEAAHVRDTDFDALVAARLSPLAHHLFNTVEDMRVEKELAAVYPGCREHFKKMYRAMLKGAEASDTSMPGHNITSWLMSAIFSGQYPDVEFPVEVFRKAVDDQFPSLITQLEQFIQPGLDCDSTLDSVAWGEDVESFLYQYFERSKPQKKNPTPQSPEGESTTESRKDEGQLKGEGSDQTGQTGEAGDEPDYTTDDASAEGLSETPAQPGAGEYSEPQECESASGGEESRTDEPLDEAHPEAGSDSGDHQSDADAEDYQGEESLSGSGRDDEQPIQESSDGGDEPDRGGSEDDTETENMSSGTQGGAEMTGSGSGTTSDTADSDTETVPGTGVHGTGTAPGLPGSATESEPDNSEDHDGTDEPPAINDSLQRERHGNDTGSSFDSSGIDMLDKIIQGDVSDELSDEAREALGAMVNSEGEMPRTLGDLLKKILERFSQENLSGDYLQVAVVKSELPGEMPKPLIEDAQAATKVLATRLSGLLQTQTLSRFHTGRRGRIDCNRLHRLSAQNPRVFQRPAEKRSIDTAVHILLDCSSSMAGCMPLANAACYSVASALHRIRGVNVGVTAFPGVWDYKEMNTVSPILKHSQRMHTRFAATAHGGTPMGEALWWTCQQMMALKEDRKIILVITDGYPNSVRNTEAALEAAKGLNYEVIGIGIGQHGEFILNLIENSRVINDIQELAPAMFGVLQQALTERGQS